jgi:hypothetical protein
MQYWFIIGHTEQGKPVWHKGKAFGFRRKNGKDQVFVQTFEGMTWIYAPIVEQVR